MPVARVVASIERNPEADEEHVPEVDTGPILKGGLEIRQDPKAKIDAESISKMSGVHSPTHIQGLPNRWVSSCMPEDRDATIESEGRATEPSIEDLRDMARAPGGQLGTPTWWRELEASQISRITANFPEDLGPPSIYQKSGLGLLWVSNIPHLQPQESQQRSFPSQKVRIPRHQTETYPSNCGILPEFAALG